MGSDVKHLKGYASRGGEVPYLDPNEILIVGLDVKLTDENWFAFCDRAKEEPEPEFVDDVRRNGVRQPVDVFKDGLTCVMLDGRRRVKAARIIWAEQAKAGKSSKDRIKVRVIIHRAPAMDLFAVNVGPEATRKALTASQRAALMHQAMRFGAGEKAVAEMFGCSLPTVKATLAVLDCAAPVQRALSEGREVDGKIVRLPLVLAPVFAREKREKQVEMLKEMAAAGAVKGGAATRAVKAIREGKAVSLVKSLSVKARAKVFVALQNGSAGVLGRDGKLVAAVISAVDGDEDALREVAPAVAAVWEKALEKGKEKS